MRTRLHVLAFSMLLALTPFAIGGGTYHTITYQPSDKPGELQLGVTYTIWLPENVKTIRGVIVHQHGCGSGACKGGETAAYDLHWQALAKKWDCALLGPSYHQLDNQNCRLWCDPRNGSDATFRRALGEFATKSRHPELASAPWCLWGHSGGGFWASIMQTLHPERIVAIWFRSGTAFATWEKGEIPKPTIPDAAYGIPMVLNPGAKENGDKRFNGAWTGSLAMFQAYRPKNAPMLFAPDPKTSHECGDSRYLAIPFFDACLQLRLPKVGETKLKPIDVTSGWRAKLLGESAQLVADYRGEVAESNWLPDEAFAKKWAEYVKDGATSDSTAPSAAFALKTTREGDRVTLTWDVEADFESGVGKFIITRNGETIATLPEKPSKRMGRQLFQGTSYHDTPEKPLAELKFVDSSAAKGAEYRVVVVNSVGLKSAPSHAIVAP